MARDIRLYHYDNGTLKKMSPKKLHHYTSISECMMMIGKMKKQKFGGMYQYVIVEYTGTYSSEIIYVTPMDLASVL